MSTLETQYQNFLKGFPNSGLSFEDWKINFTNIYKLNQINMKNKNVPFVDEVEIFNQTMGKPNYYIPNIPEEQWQWEFVYNFILEELNEYREACKNKDIIGVADALGDIMYVLCNGIMLHGMKDKFMDIYQEIQKSNMSKACDTQQIAEQTVIERETTLGKPCHYEKIGDKWVVFRTEDRKVQKSITYFKPNLSQFFTQEEVDECKK